MRNAGISAQAGFAAKLIAGVLHGAIDVRIYAGVVEGTGKDRHRDRTCPATADRTFVITALSGGDTADDQPDDEKHRSDVHLDLRSIVCINSDETVNRNCRPLVRHLRGSIPTRGGIESGARQFSAFSRSLEVRLVPAIRAWPAVAGMNRCLGICPVAREGSSGNFQTSGSFS